MGAAKSIADKVIGVVNVVGDSAHYARALNYYMDAEKYRMLGDNKMYKILKKRCVDEYNCIVTPTIKEDLSKRIATYLPKKKP